MGTNPMIRSMGNVGATFGSPQEFEMMLERAAVLYNIPGEDRQRADVRQALTQATQYCIQLSLLPAVQVHLLTERKQQRDGSWLTVYIPDFGEKAWKDFADRAAYLGHFRYAVEAIELSEEEVKAATALIPEQPYSKQDAGFKCRVLRTDHAEVFKISGRKYDPPWSFGFWRKKAFRLSDGSWESDALLAQRMPADTAERRARKAALMRVFTPIPLDERDERERFQRLFNYLEEETAPAPARTPIDDALPVSRTLNRDENDLDIIWA